jgi:hypothetical protein
VTADGGGRPAPECPQSDFNAAAWAIAHTRFPRRRRAGGWRATAKKAATTIHVRTRRVSTTEDSARAAARTRLMVARMVRTGTGGRL